MARQAQIPWSDAVSPVRPGTRAGKEFAIGNERGGPACVFGTLERVGLVGRLDVAWLPLAGPGGLS